MPNLERLHLVGCVNLEEVHPSLGHCRMLSYLTLYGCRKLKKLPKFVCMESLETLDLLGCTSLQEFPEICGDMHRLSKLYVGSPWIRSLPPSLSGVGELRLTYCEVLESIPGTYRNHRGLSIPGCNKLATLPNRLFDSQQLEYLKIYGCSELVELTISNSPKLDTFPEIKGDMHRLNSLTLGSTGIREVPSFIWHLRALKYLCLSGYKDLVSLPDSLCNLINLRHLFLSGCKKLEKLPENIGDLQELETLDATETAISHPPSSITKLGKLRMLSFSHDERQFQHSSSFVLHHASGLSSLRELDLSNHNILGGLPEDLGSLHFLGELNVSGSNISCLPKSINKLSQLYHLEVQFCQNLNELPGELPPNLTQLSADYHLALKSIKDVAICCLKLRRLSISNYGAVSSEQVNVLQHFRRTCIQCNFNHMYYFVISFLGVRIPELFDYQLIYLNPSWYTNEFKGFWISCRPIRRNATLQVTLVCKSDPKRKYSLKYKEMYLYPLFKYPSICFFCIPFERLWNASGNKEGKNPNDYYMLELFQYYPDEKKEVRWGIRLEYEKEVMTDANVLLTFLNFVFNQICL